MSSRFAEKERRRQKRLEHERATARAERRARVRTASLGGVVALLAVTGATALLLVAGGEREGSTAAAKGPFGPHYAGLETRREAARIPTMMDTMSSRPHFHTQLRVYVDGEPLKVPSNIGIDPGRDSMEMAGLHTHDSSGELHAEGVERATLGQFFAFGA